MGVVHITWADLPPRSIGGPGRPPKYTEVLAQLRERPGHWAIIGPEPTNSAATALATRLNRGDYPEVEQGDFEALTRTSDGARRLYVRFVGKET